MLDLKNFFVFWTEQVILVSGGVDESIINSGYLGDEVTCSSA